MMHRIFIFLLCFPLFTGCSSTEEKENDLSTADDELKVAHPICFNHSVLVLDSATYYAALNSEFIQQFAYSEERQLNGYKGFYLFGKTNYLEFFHPKSFDGYVEEEGGIWICLASLKAKYLRNLIKEQLDFIHYSEDDQFHELTLSVADSTEPISTWEMTQAYYESWTKKQYHDSVDFLPVDYNSPIDADSSSNYLMKDIVGIGLTFHPKERSKVIRYLEEIGFTSYSETKETIRLSNNEQFFDLRFSKNIESPRIDRYVIRLNRTVEPSTEIIGKSVLECDGNQAIWTFQ